MTSNIVRFPEDFMFQLTIEEDEILKSQNATSSCKGQKFEADAAYIDIYQQATTSIYVVDDYMNSDDSSGNRQFVVRCR